MSVSGTGSTSSGSRLSRFGLYRTIDTRTEDFLRQSRRRQIRSGCICATVSTIVTVLVVVTMTFIFEYHDNLKKIPNKEDFQALSNRRDPSLGVKIFSTTEAFTTGPPQPTNFSTDATKPTFGSLLIFNSTSGKYKSTRTYSETITDNENADKDLFNNKVYWSRNKAKPILQSQIITPIWKPKKFDSFQNKMLNIRNKIFYENIEHTPFNLSTMYTSESTTEYEVFTNSASETLTTSSTEPTTTLENNFISEAKFIDTINLFNFKILNLKSPINSTTTSRGNDRTYTTQTTPNVSEITLPFTPANTSKFNITTKKTNGSSCNCRKTNKLLNTTSLSSTSSTIKQFRTTTQTIVGVRLPYIPVNNTKLNVTSNKTNVSSCNCNHEKLKDVLKALNAILDVENQKDSLITSLLSRIQNKKKPIRKRNYIIEDVSSTLVAETTSIKPKIKAILHNKVKKNKSNAVFKITTHRNLSPVIKTTPIASKKIEHKIDKATLDTKTMKLKIETTAAPFKKVKKSLTVKPNFNKNKTMDNIKNINKQLPTARQLDKLLENKFLKRKLTLRAADFAEPIKLGKRLTLLKSEGLTVSGIYSSQSDNSSDLESYEKLLDDDLMNPTNSYKVILLIYEYAIAVESNLVQARKRFIIKNDKVDSPTADGLHRSYFGFDQDYFERMPLLVNSLQEDAYLSTSAEQQVPHRRTKPLSTSSSMVPEPGKTTGNIFRSTPHVRRTSPRPFIFEYKSPTPTPFKKGRNSKSWVETYRNTQRLQNLHEIIKYLQNTINAKFGDIESPPTTNRIEFSGVLYKPSANRYLEAPTDLITQSSNRSESFINHKSDPLFTFKPESPGDVNLLADSFLRFSPKSVGLTREKKYNSMPMFIPIASRKKYCIGNDCHKNIDHKPKLRKTGDLTDKHSNDPLDTFKLMLDLFPSNHPEHFTFMKENKSNEPPLDISSIYLTTSQPLAQFKRKAVPTRRTKVSRTKQPRVFTRNNEGNHVRANPSPVDFHHKEPLDFKETNNVILHINLYKMNESRQKSNDIDEYSTPLIRSVHISNDTSNSTGVEDYHIGSSGVVPMDQRTSTTSTTWPPSTTFATTTSQVTSTPSDIPITTTMIPFFDSTISTTELGWPTTPPEIVKFSHEDAKVPEEYQRLWNFDAQSDTSTEITRRTSRTSLEYDDNDEHSTLSVKLKNEVETTTPYSDDEHNTASKFAEMTTPTYVPQINGHYRSVSSYPIIARTLPNREAIRKRRLEMSVSSYRKPTYVPSYVEIQRNNSKVPRETT